MFNHHLRVMSFVPRWQIAPRFRTQNVAEHSYFVVLYTRQLCELLGWGVEKTLLAIQCAMEHDMPEARTGDMPGPVKRAVTDPTRLARYELDQMRIMGIEPTDYGDEIEAVVKVADLIDEMFHVATEVAMGNSLLVRQVEVTTERFEQACIRAQVPMDVVFMVGDEVKRMQSGFMLPANSAQTDPLTRKVNSIYSPDDDEEIPF